MSFTGKIKRNIFILKENVIAISILMPFVCFQTHRLFTAGEGEKENTWWRVHAMWTLASLSGQVKKPRLSGRKIRGKRNVYSHNPE